MSIVWSINRLMRMSAGEIVHRVREQVKRLISRHKAYGWARFATNAALPDLPFLVEAIQNNASESLKEAVRASARNLLDGHFSALGVDWPKRSPKNLFPPALWRLDPVTGALWPGADHYCFAIPYRHVRDRGDIKYVWEMNRLQCLQPLAAAFVLFSDQDALAAVDAAICSWMDANPPFQGLAWNSGIELALRIASLVFAATLCGDHLRADTRRRIGTLLGAHAYWLKRYPSAFSSANNHRIAELMGLALTGRNSGPALAVEAARQIFADGTPAEQSPSYGAFTAEMLLLCAASAKAGGDPPDAVTERRLADFARFVGVLADGAGQVPAIGDDDEGRVLTLCTFEQAYPASVARAIAGFLGIASNVPSETAPSLRDAVFSTPPSTMRQDDGLFTFRDGGQTIVRGGRFRLTLDHGPLGYLSIAAHGHADANAITLSIDDKPVFVDPGTYLYHSGARWRDWFRGTRAHNTLTIGAADQSRISGPFNWCARANAALLHASGGPNWSIGATHDGYRRRFGVDHQRTIIGRPNGFDMLDALVPALDGIDAELVFQLAPDLRALANGDDVRIERTDAAVLELTFGTPGTIAIAAGGHRPDSGWISPRFGIKVAAQRISWSGTIPRTGLRTTIRFL